MAAVPGISLKLERELTSNAHWVFCKCTGGPN